MGAAALGLRHAHAYDELTDAQLLEKVRRGWRESETPCGSGSTIRNSAHIRALLPVLCWFYQIESIVDAGAGDLHWARLIDHPNYQGFDLYPRHPSVTQHDITKQVLPKADLIICRHVLNHLSVRMSTDALRLFGESGSKYLLLTTCDNQQDYWGEYDLKLIEPIARFKDCQHWYLELYKFEHYNLLQ